MGIFFNHSSLFQKLPGSLCEKDKDVFASHTQHIYQQCYEGVKLDMVAPLMTNPPLTNSTTMHLVGQDSNLCLGDTSYLPGPEKPMHF